MQLALERWRSENPSYANCSGVGCGSGTYPTVPTSLYYTIDVTGANATSYTITATPKSGSAQANDRCGNLSATQNLQSKPTWSGDADCNQ
jgi:type IV pilus assembly protein PilE